MISQSSNNRPSGSSAKSCDAGIPIVGRTSSTGVYEILKVNPDGSISTGATPVSDTIAPYTPNPSAVGTPGGVIAAGTLIVNTTVIGTAIDAGLYRINPYFAYAGAAGGSVNIMLIKQGSTIETYVNTRGVYVDTYNPTISDISDGIAAYWHGNAIQDFGISLFTAYNRSNAQNYYLESGTYNMVIWVNSGITQSAPTQYVGFLEFSKIG